MKTNLSAIALGLALAYAAFPAVAATTATIEQGSSTNDAYIEQSGTDSTTTAKVTQNGSGNMAGDKDGVGLANQVNWQVGGVYQSGGADNTATVLQNGNDGVALVRQVLTVDSSEAIVKQGQESVGSSLNKAYVRQAEGSVFSATIDQNTTGAGTGDNSSYISQYGTSSSNLKATITQTGSNNNSRAVNVVDPAWPPDLVKVGAAIAQTGSDHMAEINQSGNENAASILQSGTGNTILKVNALVDQSGNLNTATVTQSGSDGYAKVDQFGNSNTATVTQSGSNDYANVNQSGGSNKATVDQLFSGAYNSANIYQTSSNNVAEITQSGVGATVSGNNFAAISQDASSGTWAYITQSGGLGNSAGIYQH